MKNKILGGLLALALIGCNGSYLTNAEIIEAAKNCEADGLVARQTLARNGVTFVYCVLLSDRHEK